MKPIYPCLWYDGKALEAATFYCSIFPNSVIVSENPVVVIFKLNGEKFMGLNGGSMYKPNKAISYMVTSESVVETKDFYNKLLEGGQPIMSLGEYPWSPLYGWVQDKYGVHWQLYTGALTNTNGQVFSPTLMFTGSNCGRATEAIQYYLSVFKSSQLQGILNYAPDEEEPTAYVKHAQFLINDFTLMAMDSSKEQDLCFTEGNSFVLECKDQPEIDYYWNTLTKDGAESQCGWLKDKYGVSWQVIPKNLGAIMSTGERGQRAMAALLKMKKLIIAELENA